MSKDNPVPSINIEEYREFLVEEGYTENGPVINLMISCLEKYLHGVETNKAQPRIKHTRCTCESSSQCWQGCI